MIEKIIFRFKETTKKLIAIINPKNKTPEQIFEEYRKAVAKRKDVLQKQKQHK